MNAPTDNGIMLGIFTGNHAGAEAHFEAGEYSIGSALECDVALTDSTLASRHCAFFLAEDGTVRLIPLEGTVTLDGEKLSDPIDWPARVPVLAGMVCLAWTPPGQGWEGMKLPSLLATGEDSAGTKTESQNPETNAETGDTGSARPETAGKDAAKPEGARSRQIRRLTAAGLVVLFLIGLTIALSPSDNKNEIRLKTLKHVLSAEGFTDLQVEESAGRVMIYGLVPTEVDANTVRSIAAGQSYPVQVIVRESEGFSSAILSALAGHGLFPQVRIERGEAVLLGYALDSLTENAALSWARNAVPRVAPIRSSLLTRSAVEKTLTAELAKAGLAGNPSVDWRPGVIILNGEAADKEALAGVIEAVRGALNSPIAFQLAIAHEQERIFVGDLSGKAAPEALPSKNHAPNQTDPGSPFGERLSLRSVTPAQDGGAGLPFITTSDGAVYFVGGTLPNGYTLTGIYTDRLEFSKNGTTMAYKLQGH